MYAHSFVGVIYSVSGELLSGIYPHPSVLYSWHRDKWPLYKYWLNMFLSLLHE